MATRSASATSAARWWCTRRPVPGQQATTIVVESIWPNRHWQEGIGINLLLSADPAPPNGGAVDPRHGGLAGAGDGGMHDREHGERARASSTPDVPFGGPLPCRKHYPFEPAERSGMYFGSFDSTCAPSRALTSKPQRPSIRWAVSSSGVGAQRSASTLATSWPAPPATARVRLDPQPAEAAEPLPRRPCVGSASRPPVISG